MPDPGRAPGRAHGGPRRCRVAAESIADTIPDGTVTIDEKAIIRSFSSASERLFGYGASEVIGENVKILMPSPYHDRHDGYIARYLETGEKRIMGSGRIVVGRRRDGTTFPMELHVAEMFLCGRRAFLGAIRDITRRDEAGGRGLSNLMCGNSERR